MKIIFSFIWQSILHALKLVSVVPLALYYAVMWLLVLLFSPVALIIAWVITLIERARQRK